MSYAHAMSYDHSMSYDHAMSYDHSMSYDHAMSYAHSMSYAHAMSFDHTMSYAYRRIITHDIVYDHLVNKQNCHTLRLVRTFQNRYCVVQLFWPCPQKQNIGSIPMLWEWWHTASLLSASSLMSLLELCQNQAIRSEYVSNYVV